MKLSELIDELLALENEVGEDVIVYLLEVADDEIRTWNANISVIEVRTDKDNKKIVVII